jgi:hypothetical protein
MMTNDLHPNTRDCRFITTTRQKHTMVHNTTQQSREREKSRLYLLKIQFGIEHLMSPSFFGSRVLPHFSKFQKRPSPNHTHHVDHGENPPKRNLPCGRNVPHVFHFVGVRNEKQMAAFLWMDCKWM